MAHLRDDPKVQALVAAAHTKATKAALAHAVSVVKFAELPEDLTPKHKKAVLAVHKSLVVGIKSGPAA